jgi:hypothetical protein
MSKIANQKELEFQLAKQQMADSIIKYRDSVAKAQQELLQLQQQQKSQPASPAVAEKKQAVSSSNRSLHWAGSSNDKIGNVIYEALTKAGVKKTPCSDNGIKITPGKAACGQNTVGKVTCSYSAKLTLAYCNGNQTPSVSQLEMPEKIKLNGDDENKIKKEIENMLRNTDFSQWVQTIKGIK